MTLPPKDDDHGACLVWVHDRAFHQKIKSAWLLFWS